MIIKNRKNEIDPSEWKEQKEVFHFYFKIVHHGYIRNVSNMIMFECNFEYEIQGD